MATSEEIENAKRLREEYEDLKNLSRELNDEEKKRLEILEKVFEQLEKTVDRAQTAVDRAKAYVDNMENVKKTIEVQNLNLEASLSLLNAQKDLQIALIKNGSEQADQAADMLAELNKQIDALKEIQAARQRNTDILEYETSLHKKSKEFFLEISQLSKKQTLTALSKSLTSMVDSGADAFLGRFTGAVKEAFFSFDELSKAFERQYAMGEDFTEQTRVLYKDLSELSVSMEDLTESAGALIDNFTDFTLQTKEQQKALRETAAVMEKSYGIAFEDFSKGLQVSTKMMGMSTGAAKSLSGELAATADALGVSVPGLVNQFASMGPSLAKFGTEGVKHFKELARISKLTGIEIEKLLSITEKFDTFEGAAERAGMLNAALGGNFVNAMDLMMETDPAGRFQMIRNAIDQTGLSFDEMGYYQKQFFAEAAGLDGPADLALLMSGNMDLLTGATNQSAESLIDQKQRAADLQSVMEKLQAVFMKLATSFDLTTTSAEDIADAIELIGKGLLYTVGLFKIASIVIAFNTARQIKNTAAKLADIAAGGKAGAMTAAQTAALEKQNAALVKNIKLLADQAAARAAGGAGAAPIGAGAAAFGKAATIAAIAGAMLAFGKAIEFAAAGVERMAAAIKTLNSEQLQSLEGIMIGLTLALGGLSLALIKFAPVSAVAGKAMLGLGVAILGIGAGIGLATAGLALLVEQIGKLDGSGLAAFAVAMVSMAVAAYKLAPALMALANPLAVAGAGTLLLIAGAGAALGVAFGALFGAFKKDKTTTEDMGVMFEKMGGVDLGGAKAAFESIKKSVNQTDLPRLEGYTAVAKNLIVNNPVAAVTAPQRIMPNMFAAVAGAAGGGGGTTRVKHDPIEVDIKINSKMFRAEVINAQNERQKEESTQGL